MVVTSRTRNAVVRKGTWVRIPLSPFGEDATLESSGMAFLLYKEQKRKLGSETDDGR